MDGKSLLSRWPFLITGCAFFSAIFSLYSSTSSLSPMGSNGAVRSLSLYSTPLYSFLFDEMSETVRSFPRLQLYPFVPLFLSTLLLHLSFDGFVRSLYSTPLYSFLFDEMSETVRSFSTGCSCLLSLSFSICMEILTSVSTMRIPARVRRDESLI